MHAMDSINPSSALSTHKQLHSTADEVVLSPVLLEDLPAIAQGYYTSFPQTWHDTMEPPSQSTASPDVRVARFAKRMQPWLLSPDIKLTKATLKQSGQIIGHAGWLRPSADGRHVLHHWRRDAVEKLEWREMMGWEEAEVEEMWEHVDLEAWGAELEGTDEVRRERMSGVRHWFLAPLWVLPEYQGRGVASVLLRETLDLADAESPSVAVYLETMPEARKLYERFGFEGLPGLDIQMVRWPKIED